MPQTPAGGGSIAPDRPGLRALRLRYETFVARPRTVYAVTGCPKIISGTSRRRSEGLKARDLLIGRRDMAGGGKAYRHDYGEMAVPDAQDAVQIGLPPQVGLVG